MSRKIVRHKVLPLTREQETFCLEYVKHGNASEAFRVACPGRSQNNPGVRGSQLLQNPAVKTRLAELAEASRVVDELSIEFLTEELKKNITQSRDLGDFNASNKAIELAMRYKAMIGEKIEKKPEGTQVNVNLFGSGDRDKDMSRLANIAGYKLVEDSSRG